MYIYDVSQTRAKSSARQRIVETAERLFYADGIRSVGIDRIIAEAEVAKMTLYNHFASKDDLILAVLQYREEQFEEFLQTAIARYMKGGMDRLEAFFATLKEWFGSRGYRGCSFINASVELADPSHPASRFATEHKCRFDQMLNEIVVEVAGKKAASVAPAIALLVEGAIVTAVMDGNSDAADVAREAAFALMSKKRAKGK
jgi:AcrR family transcriptional regulator